MLFAIPSASFGCINAMLHHTFLFLGQLWQMFEVSQILEFLRYMYHAPDTRKDIEGYSSQWPVMAPSPICSTTSEQLDLLRLWKMRSWLWQLPRPELCVWHSKGLKNLDGWQLRLSDWPVRQSCQLTVRDVFPPNWNSLKMNWVSNLDVGSAEKCMIFGQSFGRFSLVVLRKMLRNTETWPKITKCFNYSSF